MTLEPEQRSSLVETSPLAIPVRTSASSRAAILDRAYDAIVEVSDRSSSNFRDAEALYHVWIKAMDSTVTAVLDELDALGMGRWIPRPAAPTRRPYAPLSSVWAGQIDLVFREMKDVLHARDLIKDEEDDTTMLRVLPRPSRSRAACVEAARCRRMLTVRLSNLRIERPAGRGGSSRWLFVS